jgi:hypothetical protein
MRDFDIETYGESVDPDEHSLRQPLWIEVLRWIGVLPGAVLGAGIIHVLSKVVMWLGSSRFGDDTWFDLIWREVITNGVYGAAIVGCAFYIAPRGKAIVATVFAGLVLFLSGFLFFVAFGAEQWMSLVGILFMNVGSIWMTITAWSDEL